MGATWKLQVAKAQFSKVVDDALPHGPQYVTRCGEKPWSYSRPKRMKS